MNAPDPFVFKPAVREQTPLLIGLVGPSGSGKTLSALRLAKGIQSVVGGEIAAIDTEARRMLHYASRFDFKYLEFGAPFGSDRYLAAVHAAVEMGAKTIIVDSMSHEHEGPGGHLEFHDEEVRRLMAPKDQGGGGFTSEFAAQIPAWTKPAARRRRFINGTLQLKANFIFCFRAKEKIKLVKKGNRTEPQELGWQAIAGEEFVYEMTDRLLLVPGCQGKPAWDEAAWATGVPKMPDEHREIFVAGAQLDEETGEKLAIWALGAPGPLGDDVVQAFAGIGVTPEQIATRLGREPNSHDTKALKAWYRELRASKTPAPTPAPATETVDRSTTQLDLSDQAGAPVVTYAALADRLQKAKDSDAGLLVLDEGRALPADQAADLQKLFDQKFPVA